MARSMMRTVIDEYRADRFASFLLQSLTKAPEHPDGVHQADLLGSSYAETFGDVLDKVWPGWPDAVEDYRHHGCTLDALCRRLFEDTDQVLTLLAHAQACADVGDEKESEPFAGLRGTHRASELYLRSVWSAVMNAMDGHGLIPPLAEFAAADLAVCDAGEAELIAMWGRLGLTFDTDGDRSYYVHVSAPQR